MSVNHTQPRKAIKRKPVKDANQKVVVKFDGQDLNLPVGTSVSEILGKIFIRDKGVVGATLNNHMVSLDTRIDGDAVLEAVVCHSREGQAIVRRSATHVFHAAVERHYPHITVIIGQSLMGGYYYDLQGEVGDLEAWAEHVTAHMQKLVDRDLPLERHTISVEAADRWLDDPFGFKRQLLRGWPSPRIHLVGIDGYHDILSAPCAPSTGCLHGVRVVPYPPGVILCFPETVTTSPPPVPGQGSEKLFQIYRETRDWNQLIGVSAIGDLTVAALEDRSDEIIRLAEALHEKKIAQIADQITSRREQLRLVCIAGPSSSGKTTFLRRLSIQLKVVGIQPVPISLDDFYRRREDTPRDEDGDYDFEALEALDLELLDKTLGQLLRGKEVRMPKFDFQKGRPTDSSTWERTRLYPHQLAVIEGIHGLNPALVPSLPREQRFNIFVSALTQLMIDEHNRIFTSDSRLLRRIVRDRRYRGFSATNTIERWPSVRRGEERNIFPFQSFSDSMFNSTLVYETAVLRPFAWRYLLEVPRSHPSRVRAYELLKFLELVVPVLPDAVPANSVLREFIGGSGFTY